MQFVYFCHFISDVHQILLTSKFGAKPYAFLMYCVPFPNNFVLMTFP